MTLGVVQWRKQSRFDCFDPLSRIMIPARERREEREILSFSQPPTRKTEGNQETEKGKIEEGRERLSGYDLLKENCEFVLKNILFFDN